MFSGALSAQETPEKWLDSLTNEITRARSYDAKKGQQIIFLHRLTTQYAGYELFQHYSKLYEEYAVFNFDSAYSYAEKMLLVATEIKNPLLQKQAVLNKAAVLLSAGMFKEVFELLSAFNSEGLSTTQKQNYYLLKARSYFDLADYSNNTSFTKTYSVQAEQYIDSALAISVPGSFILLYYSGLKAIRAGDVGGATNAFKSILAKPNLSLHEQAIIQSTYSDTYIRRGLTDSAIVFLAKAAIADIQSSTKETTATLHLANLLFEKGDINHAAVFMEKAAGDAKFFGARQRLVQMNNIQFLIETERVAVAQRAKKNVVLYAVFVSALLLIVLVVSIIITRQVKRLKHQRGEIHEKTISLQHLADEKEWLLQEVHHRVKNNLHTINSLLESQSAYLDNEALQAVKNSQRRVYAMSLIHQKLYQPSKRETSINMAVYLQELVDYLSDSFDTQSRVEFQLDLEDVALDIYQAVPVALILNEAITNALKYAFPNQAKGLIKITLKKQFSDKMLLIVEDNGTGLPAGFDIRQKSSLGMRLMHGLSEEINATFDMATGNGTRITITFSIGKNKNASTASHA